MIGTAAALGTMFAVKAGSDVVGAIMSNKAAGKAAKAQQAAAADANRVAGGVYRDAMAMTQPYRNAGTQSMNLLGSLMLPSGAPGGYRPGMPIGGAPPTMPPMDGMGQAMPRPGAGIRASNINPWMMAQGLPPGPPPMPPPGYINPWMAAVGGSVR